MIENNLCIFCNKSAAREGLTCPAASPQSNCCHALLRANNENVLEISNKFSKIAKHLGLYTPVSLLFDVVDLKLRDLAKLCFFKLIIMTKSNFKKSPMMLFQ